MLSDDDRDEIRKLIKLEIISALTVLHNNIVVRDPACPTTVSSAAFYTVEKLQKKYMKENPGVDYPACVSNTGAPFPGDCSRCNNTRRV